MSEKRFFTKVNKNGRNVIIDKECHIEIIDLTIACEVLNRLDLKLKTYNEQLKQLQDLCGESDSENAKLRLKSKELQEEIKLLKPTNIEQYEQIVQLQEENEQLRQILKDIVIATDETYTKNASMFKVTVVLDFEKYMEIRRCIE